MFLKSLYLKNFRIYKSKVFEFSPKINLIFGENAIGKTTILEAIHYLISGKSFRTEKLQDLIMENENYFYIEAQFLKHGILQSLKISFDGKERSIVHNNTKLRNATHLLGILQGVLLTPDDVDLIKGAPALRRRFFDLQIAQADPLYVYYLGRYKQAMQQRNYLLRMKKIAAIESFEYEMARSAAYIAVQRNLLVKDLNMISNPLHTILVGSHEALNFEYKTHGAITADLEKFYIELFKKNRAKEMEVGLTLAGPHKDDLNFFLNNKDVRQFASEGQQRSLISTLRLSEWLRLKSAAENDPLMLIDDLGISLDDSRKLKQLSYLSNLTQVFITMTKPEKWQSGVDVNLIEIAH